MKSYKEFSKRYIGSSDVASLTLIAPNRSHIMHFGEDGAYYAYFIEGEAEIGEHYQLEFECSHCWLWIYDDRGRTQNIGDGFTTIKVYRAGLKGCIIQVFRED